MAETNTQGVNHNNLCNFEDLSPNLKDLKLQYKTLEISPSTRHFSDYFDTSFQELSNEHPSIIEEAYRSYEIACLGSKIDSVNLLNKSQSTLQQNDNDKMENQLFYLIKKNQILKDNEYEKFLQYLKNQNLLYQTLKELLLIFSQAAFNQIIYIIWVFWKKFNIYWDKLIIKNPLLPKFSRQYDFDNLLSNQADQIVRKQVSYQELTKQANKIAMKSLNFLYSHPKITNINMKDLPQSHVDRKKQFSKFLKVLSSCIYQIGGGYLANPNCQLQLGQKRLHQFSILSCNQDSQDNDTINENLCNSNPQKKRKTN